MRSPEEASNWSDSILTESAMRLAQLLLPAIAQPLIVDHLLSTYGEVNRRVLSQMEMLPRAQSVEDMRRLVFEVAAFATFLLALNEAPDRILPDGGDTHRERVRFFNGVLFLEMRRVLQDAGMLEVREVIMDISGGPAAGIKYDLGGPVSLEQRLDEYMRRCRGWDSALASFTFHVARALDVEEYFATELLAMQFVEPIIDLTRQMADRVFGPCLRRGGSA